MSKLEREIMLIRTEDETYSIFGKDRDDNYFEESGLTLCCDGVEELLGLDAPKISIKFFDEKGKTRGIKTLILKENVDDEFIEKQVRIWYNRVDGDSNYNYETMYEKKDAGEYEVSISGIEDIDDDYEETLVELIKDQFDLEDQETTSEGGWYFYFKVEVIK